MTEYLIHVYPPHNRSIEVEADNEREAYEKARQEWLKQVSYPRMRVEAKDRKFVDSKIFYWDEEA